MTLQLDPDRYALFLDFDGTLVDIAPRPDAIEVAPTLPSLLDRLSDRFGGAVAVVSGRPLAEIDHYLAPARLVASGLHGLERRPAPDAAPDRDPPPASVDAGRRAIRDSGILGDGVVLEDKGLSLAVHYRLAPDREEPVRALVTDLTGAHEDLSLLSGKMVFEVKPASASKATAVRRLVGLPAFAGRLPVFVGDDVTDEDGMRAALDLGGDALKVGDGETVARHRLPTVAAVHQWLESLLRAG